MAEMFVKKNGLLFSSDEKTVIGVDDTSNEFNGKIPFGALYVDDEVFSECPYKEFSFPDSIKGLGKALLKDSKGLEKVKLPAFINRLPAQMFAGCSSLKKVVMPNELIGFSEGLFSGCKSLEEIPFRAGITILPKEVFADCTSLKSLVIPNTVESIEENAVAGCTGLESVVFPAGIVEIAENAFEGCTSIHNIRINGESDVFYVSEEDGCLYMKDSNNLVVQAYKVNPTQVDYFEENVDDKPIEANEDELDDDNDEPMFPTEIGDEDIEDIIEGDNMSDEENVDSMLADIMGEERERVSAASDVSVSEKESEALSEAISVMEDSSIANNGGTVTDDELAKLFSKNEEDEIAAQKTDDAEESELDSKSKILIDSVSLSKILNFNPVENSENDSDLFVIAEKTVTGEDGQESFSAHLESCCSKMAMIHDFKRVIMLYGLPLDNDEFMEFYRHFIGKKNLILACEADRASKLSDYCKTVCENSRISLDKADLAEQRKHAAVKTDNLVKLVVRDTYE